MAVAVAVLVLHRLQLEAVLAVLAEVVREQILALMLLVLLEPH